MAKRRKAWASAKIGGHTRLFSSKTEARKHNPVSEVVELIERLPGDVILPKHVAGAVNSQLRRIRATLKDLCAWDDLVILDGAIGLLRGIK
jgi:hypothetical protein